MDLELLVERYRQTKVTVRSALVALLTAITTLVIVMPEIDELNRQRDGLVATLETKRTRYRGSKGKADQLPALKERFVGIERDLEKLKRFIPDEVDIDRVLATIGIYERELGLTFRVFEPAEIRPDVTGVGYVEFPIRVEIEGDFTNVMVLMDRIIHLKKIVFIDKITMEAVDVADDLELAPEDLPEGAPVVAETAPPKKGVIKMTAELAFFKLPMGAAL